MRCIFFTTRPARPPGGGLYDMSVMMKPLSQTPPCFILAVISLVVIVLVLEYGSDDKPVTKVANNKYSITLLTNAIIREGGSRKPSPQDQKDHLAEITARMEQGGVCADGFIITDMSYMPLSRGPLVSLVTKNIHLIEYTLGCSGL